MRPISLNVDIGEGMPWDGALLGIATAANVGCGAHAGSFRNSVRVAHLARANGVAVGAHPGYPDREGFGRRSPSPEELIPWLDSIKQQLDQMVNAQSIDYVKPHGALYHDLLDAENVQICEAFIEWLADHEVPLMGMAGTHHQVIADHADVTFISEGFVERGYDEEGKLIARGLPGAELTELDRICRQGVALAEVGINSLCVHGDRGGCVEIAQAVRATLETAGYEMT